MNETGVAIREDRIVVLGDLETRFAVAVRQRELLESYIRERLKAEKHFYKDQSNRHTESRNSYTP